MFIFCWLLGHIFRREELNVTVVSHTDAGYSVTQFDSRVLKLASCARCGCMNPEFLEARQNAIEELGK